MLHQLVNLSQRLLVEPQPWKCYKTAERRAKRAGEEPFPAMKDLKMRGPGVEQGVLDLCKEAGMEVEDAFKMLSKDILERIDLGDISLRFQDESIY